MNNPKQMRHWMLAAVLLASAFCSLNCRRSAGGNSLVKLVPATSIIVLKAKWREVRQDDRLRQLVKGDDIERVLQGLGINGDAVDDLVIFGNANDLTHGSSGIILSCSSKAQTIVAQLRSQGWEEQVYRARKLYYNSTGERWFAPLKDSVLVMGTKLGVEATLNAELDSRTSLAVTEMGSQLINQVGKGQRPISFFLVMPQPIQDMGDTVLQVFSVALDFAGLGLLGELLNKVGVAKGIGCSLSRNGNSFPVELLIIMKDEGAASYVSGTLNLLKQASSIVPQSGMSEADRERFKSYQSLVVTRNHAILTIKMTMLERDLLPERQNAHITLGSNADTNSRIGSRNDAVTITKSYRAFLKGLVWGGYR